MNHGAKINIPDYKGRTPLYFAAKYGNQESVAFLLGKKVLAAIGDARHRTPIHAAAKSGKDYIIKKFLSIGMHSLDSIRDINGDTPLHYAVKSKQIKVIELLISNNPSLMYEQNRKGESPLTLAASLEQRQIIDMMFQNGATFQPCESFFALKKGVAKDDINTIKELTKKNLDVKIRQRNLSIIDYSVESDSLSILQFFDKQSMMDKNDLLPIALAYLHGRRQIFDFLVDAYQIRNPEEALKPFLPKLAPPSDNERIEMIKKAKKISKEIYHPPSDVLKKVGIKFVGDNPNLNKLLWKAYSDHNPEQMKLLLQYGANPNSRNENGDTLLLAATNDSNINVIHLLCLFGVNPDKQSKNSKRCPLYNAIVNTKIDVIVALIMNGANLYSIDDNHNSAYHIAIQNKKNEIVKLFIQYGLDINCKNDEGKTPLHVAIELNNVDICNLLISSGALINTCDNNNITPRDLATRSGNGSIIQLLFKSKTETIDPRLVVHQ